MAQLKHNLEYVLARSAVAVVRLMSARMTDAFAAGIGSVAYHLMSSRRRIAEDNLRQALINLSEKEVRSITKRVFQNIARSLLEAARFGVGNRNNAIDIIVPAGEEHIHEAYRKGKGAVFLTAHFGNWELMGSWPTVFGYPVDFFAGIQHNAKINELLNESRRRLGVEIIPISTSTARGVFKALKDNRFVTIAADQHAPAQSIVMDFFGRKAAIAKGPALFATRTGCPILPFLLRRERFDRHVVIPGEPIYPPQSGDEEGDIINMTAAYLKFFEEVITKYPDQWMWTHRRWKILSQ